MVGDDEHDGIEGDELHGTQEERRRSIPTSPRAEQLPPVLKELTARGRPKQAVTPEEIEAFIVALAQCGQFNQAAYGVGRSPQTFRALAMNDPGFCVQVDDALQDYSEMLQGEAVRRGFHGVVEPVFGKVGKDEEGIIGWKRVYSDRLLELELRASNKMKYAPPPAQSGVPLLPDGQGPQTGVAVLPERSKSHEEWEREHGPAAQGRLSQKVTRPVVARKTNP